MGMKTPCLGTYSGSLKKTLVARPHNLGAPGAQAPVRQQPCIYVTADWSTGGSVPKMLQCTSSQNKMASHRSYTSEEVLAEIFADPDSDFDGESSSDESYTAEVLSESTESSESDESDELCENDAQENTPRPARGRGHGVGRGQAQQHNGAA